MLAIDSSYFLFTVATEGPRQGRRSVIAVLPDQVVGLRAYTSGFPNIGARSVR
jgi:hypothetical protein